VLAAEGGACKEGSKSSSMPMIIMISLAQADAPESQLFFKKYFSQHN